MGALGVISKIRCESRPFKRRPFKASIWKIPFLGSDEKFEFCQNCFERLQIWCLSCSDLLTSLLCIIGRSENFLPKLLYSLLLKFSLRLFFRILIYDGHKILRDFSNTQHCRVNSSAQFLLKCVAICRSKIYSILIFIMKLWLKPFRSFWIGIFNRISCIWWNSSSWIILSICEIQNKIILTFRGIGQKYKHTYRSLQNITFKKFYSLVEDNN